MPMIDPPPAAFMAGIACLIDSIVPTRLRSTVARTASVSASANGPMCSDPPALATRMSSPPVGSAAKATAAAISSSTVMSATMRRIDPPSPMPWP